jgi:hypothetical protein
MFQGKTIATVGFCLGLVLLAVSVGPAKAALRSYTFSPSTGTLVGTFTVDFDTATGFLAWAFDSAAGTFADADPFSTFASSACDTTTNICTLSHSLFGAKLPILRFSANLTTGTADYTISQCAVSSNCPPPFNQESETGTGSFTPNAVLAVKRTTLEGTFKGRNWCAGVVGMRAGTEEATKTKINDPVTIVWTFDDFPDIDAVITNGPLNFVMDGIAVRKNDKKGFFIMEGRERATEGLHFQQLAMQGSYKNDVSQLPAKNVPTKINGNWWMQTLSPLPVSTPTAIACVTQTGSFSAKGNGVATP